MSYFSHQVVDGEVYPPSVKDAPIRMNYPSWIPPEKTFAIGQEVFGIIPGLTMYATLWLREHNRVCDILKAEHPTWDDEQLFQTSRLIIIGEKYIILSYVNLLSDCISASFRRDDKDSDRGIRATAQRIPPESEVRPGDAV